MPSTLPPCWPIFSSSSQHNLFKFFFSLCFILSFDKLTEFPVSLSPCRCNHVLSAPKAYQPSGRQRCWASQEQGDGGRGGPSGHGLCCQHPAAGKTNSAFSQCVKENIKLWWNLIIKWPPVSTIWSKEVSTPWEAAVSRKRDELSPPKHCFSLVKPEMW